MSDNLARAIMTALGLEGAMVRAITIRMEVGLPTSIVITRYAGASGEDELAQVIERFQLEAIELNAHSPDNSPA